MIIQPAQMSSVMDSVGVLCYGDSTGMAWVVAGGGSAPYTYLWSTGSTNDTITGAASGMYWVVITDTAGCSNSDTITIVEPPVLTAQASSIDVLCYGDSTGTVSVTSSGGVGTHSYLWNTGDTRLR